MLYEPSQHLSQINQVPAASANEIAKANAEEKILAAFENWRRMAVTSFQRDALKGIDHLQQQRQAALKKALVLEISKAAADHAANP